MNKYENEAVFTKKDRAVKMSRDKTYATFREIVLNNKDYALGKAKEIIAGLERAEALELFVMFNEQEGALPDNLAREYIELIYSPESLEAKITTGLTFYEALAAIAQEIKMLKINLSSELVNKQIKICRGIIESQQNMAVEAKQIT